jgi:hypothetical protein
MYLLNSAIILDIFVLTNGIVYLMDSMPHYYDNSIYDMAKNNVYNGLSNQLT